VFFVVENVVSPVFVDGVSLSEVVFHERRLSGLLEEEAIDHYDSSSHHAPAIVAVTHAAKPLHRLYVVVMVL